MQRRDFISLLGGLALSAPIGAQAQSSRLVRIGVLMGIAESDPEAKPRVEALEGSLKSLGWTEGQNIHFDYRWTAGDPDKIRRFAEEMVTLNPEIIVAHSTPVVKALRQLTSTMPIVFVLIADPIGSGFVTNLAHPGGNVTGFMNVDAPMAGKWLELIKEIAPKVTRVALVYNPRTSPYQSYLHSFDESAKKLGAQAVPTPVLDASEIESAFASLGSEPDSALFVVPDVFVQVHRELIIRLAERYRLPAIYPYRFFPESGGLMSYGIDTVNVFRQAASYVDRILKGAAPGELPVQAPTSFQLVINLKAANAIGLTIPESFLVRADAVIE
jgi:putative tryptophan/tyrosine transport system substrate-binding protein